MATSPNAFGGESPQADLYSQLNQPQDLLLNEASGDQHYDDKGAMNIEDDSEITQESAWSVITSYFDEYGLVSQQIESFNHFVYTTIQQIVTDAKGIKYEADRGPKDKTKVINEIEFGDLVIWHKPMLEEEGTKQTLHPNTARLRNLTYESELSLEIRQKNTLVIEGEDPKVKMDNEWTQIKIGMIPIMVRSKYCFLNSVKYTERVEHGECVFDQGGYFIIEGGEKAIVAQEKMADNFVYVFKMKSNTAYSWAAEIKSLPEGSNENPESFKCKMKAKNDALPKNSIVCEVKRINDPIPMVILFRALGYDSDKEIFQFICHNLSDLKMMDLVKASFEGDAGQYRSREMCLDYIGSKMKGKYYHVRSTRIEQARENLSKRFLPHLGTEDTEDVRARKAFFVGYMINRLCNAALGRVGQDDRDHYGKKRMELAGVLLGNLFKKLFSDLKSKAEKEYARALKSGRPISYHNIFDAKIISRGLKQALATGKYS